MRDVTGRGRADVEMRKNISFMTRIADRIGSFRWQTGGTTYFHIELASRHRAYVAPGRFVLRLAALALSLWVSWSAAQTWIGLQDLQEIQARIDQVREQDQQLIKEAQAEGLDLSEAALRRLPAEVSLANQLLAKRNFSWTHFLSGLGRGDPSARLDQRCAPGSGQRRDPHERRCGNG